MRSKAKARKVAQSEDDDPELNDGGESVSEEDSCDGGSPTDLTSELLPMAFTQPIQPALCHLDDTAVPPELELRESQVHGLGIWTRVHIPAATQFGPFFGKLRSVPLSSAHAWQVTDVTGKTIGWFDPNEPGAWNWMKYVRTVCHPQQNNVKSTLVKGKVYYQAIHDIEAGEEVLVSDRRVLQSETEEGHAASELQPAESGAEEKCEGDLTAAANFSTSLLPPVNLHPELDHSQLDLSQHSELSDHLGLLSQDSSSPEPLRSVSHLLFGSGEDTANGSSYKCVACDQTFTDVLRLDEHMVVDHYGQDSSCHTGEYKCDQCPKVFSWKSNLLRHQVAHEDGRRYVCENCHKVFTDPSNLQRHIRSQHIGARSHACPECGKTFATSSGLKQHTHIHSSVKPFQCEVCLKSYTQFSNLCRHKRMHADCRMQIKCHKCGQAFSTVTSLSKHKRFCEGAALTSSSSSSNASSGNPLLGFPHPHNPSNPSNEKVSPLSITQSNNPLMFYPRPGFPFYPPSLVAYPMFAGAGLPPHPSLLASSPLLMPAASVKKPDSPDSSGQASAASAALNGTLVRAEVAIKKEKRGSEGSESEISDDVSSAGISDDVDVSTGSDFDSESDQDPRSKMEKHLQHQLKMNTPNGKGMTPEMHASSLFTSPRESSPKQAAIYPELPQNLKDPLLSANGMIKALTVTCPPADMPFDLSINSKSQHMSPAAKPAPESTKEDEPLDLRMDHKKAPKHEEGSHHKTHVFGETKKVSVEMERTTPVTPVSVGDTALSPTKFQMAYPRPIHPLLVDPQLYKPKFPAFPTPERVMMPFPPRYPLLNPLMNGLNGNSSAFDMIRSQMEKMGKPYQDVLTPHVNKLKERYSCKFCGKIFPRSANLTRHLRTHTGEQPYKCKYCERSFSISSNLQRHVRNIHNKEKPFKCPLCDRCFGQQTNLDRHLKKHESDGPTILDDSPKSADLNDKDDAYFDEIRNFIGKVTDGDPAKQSYGASDLSGAAFPMTAPDLKGSPGPAAKTVANGSKSDLDDEEEDDDDDAPLVKRSKVDSDGEGRTSPASPKTPGRNSGAATPLLRSKSVAYEVMMQFNKGPDDPAPTTDKEPSENSSRTASPLPNFCKDITKTMGVCDKAVEV